MKSNKLLTILIAACAAFTALPASAILITTDGSWTDVFGNPSFGPNYIDSDLNGTNDTVEFGLPFGDDSPGSSAYIFEGTTIDAPTDGSLFAIGDFTHNNFTVLLPSITGANLLLSLMDPSNTEFTTLEFDHFETPNNANPCAAGGVGPCPDLISLPGASAMRNVAFDDMNFLLEIIGFSQDGGATVTESLLTTEGASNTATLYARLTPVPEASTLAILGIGLIGLAAVRRRKATRAS